MTDTVIQFSDLALNDAILSALDSMGFVSPTPIQAAAIPHLLDGADALGKAQTGTGKTAAFSLPLLNKLDLSQRKPQAIVLAPTRELAIQVAAEMKNLGQNISGLKVLEIYGGTSIVDQMRALKNGAHVIVGTPGRVQDLINRDRLHLDEVNTFILDEADEMLNMGFVDDVTAIMEHAPASAQRVLFSATMPPMLKNIVERFLREPVMVDVAGKNHTVDKVEQQFWVVKGVEKDEAMSRLLETEETDASIVFVRTRQDTERLADWLSARGFKAAALHGDIPQSLRERTVDHIKNGVIDILVATDVVARGLDVPRITHVFNYDIPFDVESYIHRIGRTGRAGRQGKAILLVRTNQIRMLRTIERVTKSSMEEIQLPLRDAVAEARLVKLGAELEAEKEHKALEKFVELVEKLQETLEIDSSTLAAILLKRQQGKRPLFYIGEDPMVEAIARDKQRRQDRREGGRDGARREGGRSFNTQDWDTYQLQVGREQGVQVKDIVGALANELGLVKGSIGAIKLDQGQTYVQLPKAMDSETAGKLSKLRIRQKDVGAVVCDFDDFREPRGRREGGRRDGGRRDGGFRGNREGGNREGGFRGNREGGNRDGNREGGYRGNRDGNREGGYRGNREGGNREGGYRGNREGGNREGGYRGNREGGNREGGERRFDRNRGGDHRGNHRGERGHGRRNED